MNVFLDTSVLVAGLIDFGPQSSPAHSLLHAVAEKTTGPASTAWHCCLEFYSVGTRLPPEFRLTPADAARLVEEEIIGRMAVFDLPGAARGAFLAAGATVIVTDNRRHFLGALRHGIRVETPSEFLSGMKKKR